LVTGERGYDPALETAWEAQNQRGETVVAKTAEVLRARGLNVAAAVVKGDPKSKILAAAEEWHADLIVLGSHGWKALAPCGPQKFHSAVSNAM
jgi:nucleotide-binding universal stress UspA family protein